MSAFFFPVHAESFLCGKYYSVSTRKNRKKTLWSAIKPNTASFPSRVATWKRFIRLFEKMVTKNRSLKRAVLFYLKFFML